MNIAVNPLRGEPTAHYEPRAYRNQDEDRMNLAMSGSQPQSKGTATEFNESLDRISNEGTKLESWFEDIKTQNNINRQTLLADVKEAFSELTAQKEAMWYAFNKQKGLSGKEVNINLHLALKQELMGSFVSQLRDSPPTSSKQLKQALSETYSLGAHKEQALWNAWSELKLASDMAPVVDLIRQELSLVISKNAMVKNMLTHGHKLDLS